MNDVQSDTAELVYTRVFEAPRALVFRCMIEPEHLSHFWGPVGTSAPLQSITVDPRPGGVFETVMVNDADGGEYPTRAVFVEVVEPERLVWNELRSGVTTTSTFRDLGDSRTEVRIHQANVPEAFRSPQAQAGFTSSLDRFSAYLESLTGGHEAGARAAES
ncbi:MAG: SRPBCC domain-containing protein [Jatrophihabitantaceae bacterium]